MPSLSVNLRNMVFFRGSYLNLGTDVVSDFFQSVGICLYTSPLNFPPNINHKLLNQGNVVATNHS
jgi:hypothetical protein